MQTLLNPLQLELVENLSQHANILIILGSNTADHLFFTYTNFVGSERTNIGSIEHNTVKGVNITKFVANNTALLNNAAPSALLSAYHNFIANKQAVTVKYANLPYLIFGSEV